MLAYRPTILLKDVVKREGIRNVDFLETLARPKKISNPVQYSPYSSRYEYVVSKHKQ